MNAPAPSLCARGRRLAGASSGLVWACASAAWALEVTTPQVPVEAMPGADVVVPFRVTGDPGTAIEAVVDLPPEWTLLLAEEPFVLDAFGGDTRIVMLRVPLGAAPGRYPVTYLARAPDAFDVSAFVEVGEVRDITPSIRCEQERVVAGDRATFHLRVQNSGNVPADLVIRTFPDNLALDDDQAIQVRVEPGEVVEREFEGVVGSDENDARLLVRVVEGEGPPRSVLGSVAVIPRSGKADRWWRLPIGLTLWNLTGTRLDGRIGTAVQGEISAEGWLDQEDHLHLDLDLRGPDVRSVPGLGQWSRYGGVFSAQYPDWSTRVALGDGGYRFTTLTEPGLWGRGGSLDVRYGRLGVGALVARDRFFPTSTWQYAGALRFFAGERGRFSLGAHLARLPGRDQVTFTHEGVLPLLPATQKRSLDLLYEAALGNLAPAGLIDLRGRFPTTSFQLRTSFGAGSFPGEYGNLLQAYTTVQQHAGPLTFTPSGGVWIRDIERAGPKPRYLRGGLHTAWSVTAPLEFGLGWSTRERRDPRPTVPLFDVEHDGMVSLGYRTAAASLSAEAGTRLRRADVFDGTAVGAVAAVEGTHMLTGRMDASLGMAVDSNYLLRPGGSLALEPWVGWSWQPGESQIATLTYHLRLYPDSKWMQHIVQAQGDIQLPWDHWIRLRVASWVDVREGGADAFYLDAQVGYSVVFGVPLSRRHDLTTIRGVVTDPLSGAPVGDFPVRLDGYTLRTAEDGTYEFDVTPDTRHFLEIPLHDLPAGMSVAPRTQYDLAPVHEGAEPQVRDFRVMTGGTVRVQVQRYALSDPYYLWTGVEPSFVPMTPLSDEPLVMYLGDDVRHAYTDAQGVAVFDRLAPGEWTVAARNRPPTDFVYENGRRTVHVEPSESEDVLIRLLPDLKAVRFLDTGDTTVGAPEGTSPEPVVIDSFRVTPDSVVVGPGGEVVVRAQLVFSNGHVEDVSEKAMWTSSNLDVAAPGKGFVLGVAPGTATIEVQLADRPPVTMRVEVVKLPFVALSADPATIELVPGFSTRLSARSIDTNGAFKDVTREVEWVSQDPEIAVVAPDGAVLAKKEGTTKIVARLFGITAFPVQVTVSASSFAPITEPDPTAPEPTP